MTGPRATSWFVTLGIGASAVALVLAPQALGIAAAIAPPSTGLVAAFFCHAAYELALWGSGLLAWRAGHRFGFVRGRVMAMGLCLFPVAVEAATVRLLGIAAEVSGLGIAARLVIGAGVVAVAWHNSGAAPPPGTSGQDGTR